MDKITKKELEIKKLEARLAQLLNECSSEEATLINNYLLTGDVNPYRQWLKANNKYYGGDAWSKAINLYNARNTLAKYQKQLKEEEIKSNILNNLPQVLIDFKNNLIKHWDEYDTWKKQTIKEEYKNQPQGIGTEYRQWQYNMREKWGRGWYDFLYITSEQIHKNNVKDAESLVLNLINRTIEFTGEITDCSGLSLDNDNQGYLIINGLVIGEKGKARVESIGAGGYNIQRYHIRVLVKEVK